MDCSLFHILFVIAMVTRHVVLVSSCSCSAPNHYEEVCGSDFAINATVLSKSITYPEGSSRYPWDVYDVKYTLQIHRVLTPGADIDSIPTVLVSFGPGSLCGLSSLSVGWTYILAGFFDQDKDTGAKALGMFLCNLNMIVSGPEWAEPEKTNKIINDIECANSTDFIDLTSQRRNAGLSKVLSVEKQDKAVEAPGKAALPDPFAAFLTGMGRRALKSDMESFAASIAGKTGKSSADFNKVRSVGGQDSAVEVPKKLTVMDPFTAFLTGMDRRALKDDMELFAASIAGKTGNKIRSVGKHDQVVEAAKKNAEMDQLRALLTGMDKRDLTNVIESLVTSVAGKTGKK